MPNLNVPFLLTCASAAAAAAATDFIIIVDGVCKECGFFESVVLHLFFQLESRRFE